ncbi:hypothetical protein [Streptomyces virginiae]|uniref:Uncharacterized protein n=1 Tax=Streptomyces virginiae TaxID=1961 RepID=A0ABZ1TEC8_STRVG|nr:hypothetical protein [Streptomyces virginiae]
MRSVVTTLLDALALLLIAAGAAWGLAPWIGGFALTVAGVVILAGSLWSARSDGG